MLSEAFGRVNKREFVQTIKINLLSVSISSIFVSILIIVARSIILSLYGNGYREAGIVILYLSFAAIAQSITAILGQVIAGLGKMWLGVLLNFSWAIASIVGLSVIFPQVAYGLAQTYLFAYLVQMLLSLVIVIFTLKYQWL
jgi:O-antigen/teichoic acid export membrane protein